MDYGQQVGIVVALVFSAFIIIGFLLLCLSYLSDYFNDYNSSIAEIDRLAEARDRELITQSKRHTINCTEEYIKSVKEKSEKKKGDFEVDFNINLSGSIVKTEVVYAD